MTLLAVFCIKSSMCCAQDPIKQAPPYGWIPRYKTKSVEQLTAHVTRKSQTDLEKVTAIHHWITHKIRYDVKKYSQSDLRVEPPKRVLKKRRATCTGYSNLFVAMCNEAGLEAASISGLAKNWTFDVDRAVALTDHSWNAVAINGKWYLVDATWSCGYVQLWRRTFWGHMRFVVSLGKRSAYRYKPRYVAEPTNAYFLKSGDFFIYDHLPSLPDWQLNTEPKPYETFITDSAFYYLDRPSSDAVAGFDCGSCSMIAASDSLTYMLQFAESEIQFDSLNPFLLALKKTYIAELAYQPRATLVELQENLSQFMVADSLNKLVLSAWKKNKAEALRFNDMKKEDHKRYHETVWRKQVKSLQQIDKVRSSLKSSSKTSKRRIVKWSDQYELAENKLDRMVIKDRPDTAYTFLKLDSLLKDQNAQWNALKDSLLIANEKLSQLLDNQFNALLAIDSINRRLTHWHKLMVKKRLNGFDDLDWAIDTLDQLIVGSTARRETHIHQLNGQETKMQITSLIRRQKQLHTSMQKVVRSQRLYYRKWNNSIGDLDHRATLLAATKAEYVSTSAALKAYHDMCSIRLQNLANAYTSIKKPIRRERRIHQRDHDVALEAGVRSAQEIDKRYHAVYSIILEPHKKVTRRMKRLRIEIDKKTRLS